MADRPKTKGTSLAKGPAGLIGLLLLIYGITALIFGGHSFTQHVPNGTVHGKSWIGLEVNGWSDLLFMAGGLLLLFGSPLHWGAKGMSLIVGIALGAAALVALATQERGVFGLLAANHLTELVWGAAGVLLIVLSLLPRVGGKSEPRDKRGRDKRSGASRRDASEPPTIEREPAREPVKREPTGRVERQGSSADDAPTGARVEASSRTSRLSRDDKGSL